jgi:hypothetical protein
MGGPRTAEELAKDAAAALASEKVGFHGVSVYVRNPVALKALEYGQADVLAIRGEFTMHKTLGRGHYTIELPNPSRPKLRPNSTSCSSGSIRPSDSWTCSRSSVAG